MFVAESRELAGIHDYDGVVQDLSPAGVSAGLTRVGDAGGGPSDPLLREHLAAFEARAGVIYGDLEMHRRNPLCHLENLDLACYDRAYAAPEIRADARRRHLAAWPDAVEGALHSLDSIPQPVAAGLLGAAKGLAAAVDDEDQTDPVVIAARSAHARFVRHIGDFAAGGDPDASLGAGALTMLIGAPEAMSVDLGRLAARGEVERDRLAAMLVDACSRVDAGRSVDEVLKRLYRDHRGSESIIAEASAQVAEVMAFTREKHLTAYPDGDCLVGEAPASRRWSAAMISTAAPFEEDNPSWYHITPPDEQWSREQREDWLSMFSTTTLPVITVHEVAPGHHTHARWLRHVEGDVRRALQSPAFAEGWAHYAEELSLDEGFRADDPRFAVGVAIEALVRVTRLLVAIGVHTSTMDMDEAVHRFETDAKLAGPAARSEAARAAFDPGYGCYTFGKLEIMSLRDEARARWGVRYSHRRFHDTLLQMGSPPLGLIGSILD
jgi:hypothetical protein